MTRASFVQMVQDEYGIEGEHLWAKYPSYCVFRHPENRKWFALLLDVAAEKIGCTGGMRSAAVLKCDPILIGSLLREKGFFPACYMSKDQWITVALDGSVEDEKIRWLLGISYNATRTAPKKKTPR